MGERDATGRGRPGGPTNATRVAGQSGHRRGRHPRHAERWPDHGGTDARLGDLPLIDETGE